MWKDLAKTHSIDCIGIHVNITYIQMLQRHSFFLIVKNFYFFCYCCLNISRIENNIEFL